MNIIEQGIENIEKYGWIRNDLGSPEEGFCMLGSLLCHGGDLTEEQYAPAYIALTQELLSRGVEQVQGWLVLPADFNDNVAKDVDEVIDVMKHAAKRL